MVEIWNNNERNPYPILCLIVDAQIPYEAVAMIGHSEVWRSGTLNSDVAVQIPRLKKYIGQSELQPSQILYIKRGWLI